MEKKKGVMREREEKRREDRGDQEGENHYRIHYYHAYNTSRKGNLYIHYIFSNPCHPIVEQFGSYPSLRKQVNTKRKIKNPYRRQLLKALCLKANCMMNPSVNFTAALLAETWFGNEILAEIKDDAEQGELNPYSVQLKLEDDLLYIYIYIYSAA